MLNTFKYCKLSKNELNKPIVSDYLGNLYNKEDVISYLLDRKRNGGEKRCEIESLNDIVLLNIKLDEHILECPLSNKRLDIEKDLNLKLSDVQFSYIVPCGCTMNTKILRELIGYDKMDLKEEENLDHKCPVCLNVFKLSNIVDINPQDKEIENSLKSRMGNLKEKGLNHNLKPQKVKKRRKQSSEQNNEQKKRKIRKET